ncbi:hypothetical protein GE061_004788 [Apolygus lucorum]|uniref:Uncharacterized protein n=1 Tax=Apolygus lucorum TaxID=248454 RepID=A0A8S9X1P1_APOLU|nr:hypothetical protein GE061_004788 [Apolygus lucorum]
MPAEVHLGSLTANGAEEVVELFASHFSSVYDPPLATGSIDFSHRNSFSLGSICIKQETITSELASLNANKGMGPDGVPPILLKCCASSIQGIGSSLVDISLVGQPLFGLTTHLLVQPYG